MTPSAADLPAWDVAAWVGAYPFRALTEHKLDHWEARARRAGVTRAVVSGYDQLFAQNGLELWRPWVARIASHAVADRLDCWPVVNPAAPGELRRLEQALDQHPVRGLRLLPSYHGYRLWDPQVADLMSIARQRDMIVQVFVRIVDERWQWMLKMPPVDVGQDLHYFTSLFDANRIIISGAGSGELAGLANRLRTHPGLYADLSRVRGPAFALDHIDQSLPLPRLLLGTLWPVQIMEASLWEVTTSRLADDKRRAILWDNAATLMQSNPVRQPQVQPTP